jgi:hypothetical protein
MPSVAAVPIAVAKTEEQTAKISVLRNAMKVSGEAKSSLYHMSEKPSKTDVLLLALKEKKISVTIGM